MEFPNEEVRYGFLNFITPFYSSISDDDKGYLIPYTADGRQLVKVGVSFDAAERNVGDFLLSAK